MDRVAGICGLLAGALLLVAGSAQAQFSNSGVPGAQQGDVHAPWSKNYRPLLPNQPIQYTGSASSNSTNNGHSHGHHGHSNVSFYFGGGWPAWGGSYYGGYPYGYYPPYYGPLVLPPLFLPAETMFGPQAMQRFMGIDQQQPPAPQIVIANKPKVVDADAAKPKVRLTNVAAKSQAGKFMAFGDTQFAQQKFNQALERYKLATQSAPDLAETYVRQGLALVAMGRYESAARSMRRALQVQPDWSKSTFRLDQLYGDDKIAKAAHLEALARAVEENPQSADLLLLLGLQLYFDGEVDRAIPLFVRCAELGGNEDEVLKAFLPKPDVPVVAQGKEI